MINYPADLAICWWWWRRLFRIFPQWDNWRVKYIWLQQSLPNIYKCLVLWDSVKSPQSLLLNLIWKYFTQVCITLKIFHSRHSDTHFPCFCGLFQPEESTFLFMFEFEKSNKLWTLHSVTVEIQQTIITLCLRHRLRKDPLESIDSGDKVSKIFKEVFEIDD